mmetsp:Transcript_20519/g.60581  ORF Transcript_20519/g.60581 Transcript_20519/m.60581 type:complete len:220 (+) Transcript_20519:476-1135(+)
MAQRISTCPPSMTRSSTAGIPRAPRNTTTDHPLASRANPKSLRRPPGSLEDRSVSATRTSSGQLDSRGRGGTKAKACSGSRASPTESTVPSSALAPQTASSSKKFSSQRRAPRSTTRGATPRDRPPTPSRPTPWARRRPPRKSRRRCGGSQRRIDGAGSPESLTLSRDREHTRTSATRSVSSDELAAGRVVLSASRAPGKDRRSELLDDQTRWSAGLPQ